MPKNEKLLKGICSQCGTEFSVSPDADRLTCGFCENEIVIGTRTDS